MGARAFRYQAPPLLWNQLPPSVREADTVTSFKSEDFPLYYLRIENAEGNVLIAVYLFIYLYACYSRNKESCKPNHMKFGGMIGYYLGTI